MAKKRVHELATDLKLTNKDMVQKLHDWGFDSVKSHSSTLEDDQVRAVMERIRGEQKTAAVARPASGVVIRRPKPVSAVIPGGIDSTSLQAEAAESAAPEAAPEPEAEAVAAQAEPAPIESPEAAPEPAKLAESAQTVAAEKTTTTPTQPATAATTEPKPVVAPPPAPRPTANQAVVVNKVAAGYKPPPPKAPPPQARPANPVNTPLPPHLRKAGVSGTAAKTVVQPVMRAPVPMSAAATAASNELAARGGTPTAPTPPAPENIIHRGGVAHVMQQAGARPTANQAVVVSRPVFITKRVTPAGGSTNYPNAPGIKAGDTVRQNVGEISVFNEAGTRREADLKGGKKRPSTTRNEKVENYSKQDLIDLVRARAYVPVIGRKKRPTKKGKKTEVTEMKASKKVITIEDSITVREISEKMGVKGTDLIRQLMKASPGKLFTVNQPIDFATASLLAVDHGWEVKQTTFEITDFVPEVEDKPEDMKPRPPVVTVMGHVDHGKTSLLDALRSANVAEGEAGGITQHIGAYSVNLPGKGDITFLDTPGHEAFSAMRSRGAQATDIIILVVAVDDGVQPQTLESIKLAKESKVPIVVAINKIDKPGANPDVVKAVLAQQGLQPEDWGGDVPMIPVSARMKTNLDLLLENVLLQAELLELSSNPDKLATGVVIESKVERGRGAMSSVLVQDGTLKMGDAIVCGPFWGRVRTMLDPKGKAVQKVTAGYPVQVVGLSGTPDAGEDFHVVPSEEVAKKIAEHRVTKLRETDLLKSARTTVEDLLKRVAADAPKELVIIVKADVQGSAEAVTDALRKQSGKKVTVNVISKGVGGITESDVNQAYASKALVVGFNVKSDANALAAATQAEVKVKTYSIIYELLDDVRVAMEDLLEPIYKERPVGKAEIRQVFNVSKVGIIAGSLVTEGKVTRNALARVFRDRKKIHEGKLASLKRFKDDVKEVVAGTECGIGVAGIESVSELQVGDIIDLYEVDTFRQKLD
jgi:translation initiation factor IF-2